MIKGGILIVLAGMAFSLIFLAILMSNWSKIRQTKIAKDESEKYERLAAEAVEVQREILQKQKQLAEDLAEMKERLVSIEKILKEVE
ncbi:MAG: hypothetical protein AB2404_03920 [Planifilum fimeticola]|jgi:hypothetical protein